MSWHARDDSGKLSVILRSLSSVHLADIALTAVVLLTSLFTLASNDLFSYLSVNLSVVPGGIFLLIGCAILGAVLAGLIVGTKCGNVICLGWAMYLPSVLYFSRIDLLSLALPGGFRIFASSLPAPVIIVAGIILTGCTLAHGSLAEMKSLRSDYLARGAASGEVETAMRKNLLPISVFLIAAVALSVVVILLTGSLVPLTIQNATWSSSHILFLAGGTVLFALLLVAYLWSKKAG